MTQGTLHQNVNRFFDTALEGAGAHEELRDLYFTLKRGKATLANRMRVGFIGGVNNGKSTLMNAFLGEKLAETGNRELTWNVTWFRYGDHPELIVHNMAGTIEGERFETLAALTSRCEQSRSLLDRIRFVEARYPSPLLKKFDLIDTPGLYSSFQKDSANTRRFLADEETRPHAIVFLFSDTLKARDIEELDAFHGLNAGTITGINAIGTLTKADNFPLGLETAARVIDKIRKDYPWTLRRFYTILPVMGQPAYGAQTLTASDHETLLALAFLPEGELRKLLLDTRTFISKAQAGGSPMPSESSRRDLAERLGLWGIRKALDGFRQQRQAEEVKASILAASNMEHLRRIIESHFGNRAQLIQARVTLDAVRTTAFYLGERLQGLAQKEAYRIASGVDELKKCEPRFREFGVLEKYYGGEIDLDQNDFKQLLDVTGENGTSCAARLGADAAVPIPELIALAAKRESYWRGRTSDFMTSQDLRDVARQLSQSYSEIHARLCAAGDHLAAATELLAYSH